MYKLIYIVEFNSVIECANWIFVNCANSKNSLLLRKKRSHERFPIYYNF